jgi:hypothetical protein
MNRALASLLLTLQLAAPAAADPWALSLPLPKRPAAADTTAQDSIALRPPPHRRRVTTMTSLFGTLAGAVGGVALLTKDQDELPPFDFSAAISEGLGAVIAGAVLGGLVGFCVGHAVGRAIDGPSATPVAAADSSATR